MTTRQKNSCSPMRWNVPATVPQNYHAADCVTACQIQSRLSLLVSELFIYRSHLPASPDAVFAWPARPDALARLAPPWENVRVIERTGSIEQPGSRVKIRL